MHLISELSLPLKGRFLKIFFKLFFLMDLLHFEKYSYKLTLDVNYTEI